MLRINIGVGEIGIDGEVGNQAAANPILEISASGMQSVSSRAGDAAEAGEAIWFDHQQATAADFAHVGKLAALGDSLQSVDAQIGKPQIFFVLAADEAAKVDAHRLIG